ncbi:heavy-metal-associated domain-containing protein [Hydrogenovibrio halophilus]|uniref:heavy-metal-associated domain-containing protein n=1 Tax=Hydrogenovibrio halophilus TaxID=373391 RepID=UPI00037FA403|nr:heavy-metal-associated domain-containing protein [Hydrogenovibrio halophilus]
MHTETFTVDNIKCGGCASQIERKLGQIDGVASVTVSVEEGLVVLQTDEQAAENSLDAARAQLASMGYPVSGSVSGLSALGAKAKSFVSCAIGKSGSRSSD